MALLLAFGSFLMSIAVVDACGDKLLRIGRGARFQRSVQPASILIYVSAATSVSAPAKVQTFLKKAGHKPSIVQGINGFEGALSAGHYDIVLSDLSDAPGLLKQIETSTSKPTIVPIAINTTKAERTAAKKEFKCLVNDSNDGEEYLDAIETAMRSRTRTQR
jgi:DNA-binding NtrC family response regulator